MTTTAEVKTGLEGLFQSAEAKSGELKDATRKGQAQEAKKEALGQYARTVRNEHIESAIGKVQELVNAGTIIDKNTLKVEISKIVDAADKNENFKKFREVKSVAELQKLITDNPEEAKEYFTARALHFVVNGSASKVGDLASSLNLVSEGNTGTPFDTYVSTYGQFSFAGKKAPFVEEMKKVLENFTGDDDAKQALLTKLDEAAKDENIKNPNEMMQIISEATANPNSALSLFINDPTVSIQYQTALTNLRNKEVSKTDFKDVMTSYLSKLQEKVQAHMDDENVRIAARAITLKTAVEKVEVDVSVTVGSPSTDPSKKEKSYQERIKNIFSKLGITDGKEISSAYVELSYQIGGMSDTIKPQNNIHKANDLFDWLEKATRVTLTYIDSKGESITKDFYRNTESKKLEAATEEPKNSQASVGTNNQNLFSLNPGNNVASNSNINQPNKTWSINDAFKS